MPLPTLPYSTRKLFSAVFAALLACGPVREPALAQKKPARSAAAGAHPFSPPVRFDGDSIVRITPTSAEQLRAILTMTDDVWSHGWGLNRQMDIRITPAQKAHLDESGIRYITLIKDVQRLIDDEFDSIIHDQTLDGDFYLNYRTYEEINAHLDELAAMRPDIAHTVMIGTTIENRAMQAIEISGSGDADAKPGVLLNGCQHAREWIATMVPTYMAEQLITQYGADPTVTRLVDDYSFYIIPISNPDGFVYTWTTDRLWRKNRRNNGNGSFGVDLNRNWDYQWGGVGSSGQGSSDLYRGTGPFSEPETQNLRDYFFAHPNIAYHIDLHSYSQYVLTPWAFVPAPCYDGPAYQTLAQAIAASIQSVHGKVYTPGDWYTVLYPSSGVMQDWTYGVRAAWGLTIEERDTGQYGFLLPPDQIIPTAEEVFAGVETMLATSMPHQLLLESTDITRGRSAELHAYRAQPGTSVYFAYSTTGTGSTYVGALNVTLNLDHPLLIGSALANAAGEARLIRTVPGGLPPVTIWLEVIGRQTRSNVIAAQVQ